MGLSGTGRSREPGSGEVSDPGGEEGPRLPGRSSRGAPEPRDALLGLPRAFLAAFTLSLP